MIVSRVAVGLYVLRTGLGFLSSLISQSPLNSHISCYEIWHTSGFFFSPSSQLSVRCLQEPADLLPSIIIPEGLVPPTSLPAGGLLGAGCPQHPLRPFPKEGTPLSLATLPSN